MRASTTLRSNTALVVTGGLLVAGFTTLAALSSGFGYDVEVIDMPVLPMVGLLIALGLVFLAAVWAVTNRASDLDSNQGASALIWLVVVGLIARLALFASEPVLEDDYQRYLWDGAVSAAGLNPYAVVPENAANSTNPRLAKLASDAGLVLERLNHPEIRTIYPPAAQAFFVLAHKIKPFQLWAWRLVVLAADCATLLLLLSLLRTIGRPEIWAALYWWNPVVIKEFANSAHMDAILIPFVMAAILLAARRRPYAATLAVGIAVGVKIWPLALTPLVWRATINRIPSLMGCAALLAGLVALWATPMVLAGLDRSAGLVAYADAWRTNSASFTVLITAVTAIGLPDLTGLSANHITRGIIAGVVLISGFALAVRTVTSPRNLITRATLLIAIIVLISPAQFPWYVTWVAPFLALVPINGLLLLAATMPLYYVAFHMMARDMFAVFNTIVIWFVWCPVWLTLIVEALLYGPRKRGEAAATLTGRI